MTPATAATEQINPKICILLAAEKLPFIPGLAAIASRPIPLPVNMPKTDPTMALQFVEIDVKAAGQDATYTFMCSTAPGKPILVQRMGIAR